MLCLRRQKKKKNFLVTTEWEINFIDICHIRIKVDDLKHKFKMESLKQVNVSIYQKILPINVATSSLQAVLGSRLTLFRRYKLRLRMHPIKI